MRKWYVRLLAIALVSTTLYGAVPACPAGMPLGNINVSVKRTDNAPALPWRDLNRLEEGDRILYSPALRPHEKRRGEVAMVIIAAAPQPDRERSFVVLDPKDAEKPAEWKIPFRASLAVFVYGPSGLSARKLRGFIAKDEDLVAQLADYAEKTAQTENLLQALSAFETAGPSENFNAALAGFSSQFGINNKIDRSAPLEQQTMAVFQSLNPALASYDPISAPQAQRVSQTTGLATAVAGMFFGSTVGLAAGGTAMALNLKTLVFPGTEFRSSYIQQADGGAVALCGRREAPGRTRLAYLWARRLPDTGPPDIRIDGPNNLPRSLKSPVRLAMPDDHWRLVTRARNWSLKAVDGTAFPVGVTPIIDSHDIELDLTKSTAPPGTYSLAARWDWQDFAAAGDLIVRELSPLDKVRPVPESQNRLRQHNGKQVVTFEGADFQFVEKLQLIAKGDKYSKPVDVQFTLPRGPRAGPQSSIEMQVDTSPLDAGVYALTFFQQGGKAQPTDLNILPDPPKLANLPITIHEGEKETPLVLNGSELAKIRAIEADGVKIELGNAAGKERRVKILTTAELKRGEARDLRLTVDGYAQPIVLAQALRVAPPRPAIAEATVSSPPDAQIALREKELPTAGWLSAMLRVERAGASPVARLSCTGAEEGTRVVEVAAGAQNEGARLQLVELGRLFLSFNPGVWPGGCALAVTVENPGEGRSRPADLGRVVRMPRITALRLSDEAAGEGLYYATLTGQNLELIEKTGWTSTTGVSVTDLPTAVAGDASTQSLKVKMPWPSPSPRSPLFIWLRGEQDGRSTTVRP